MFGFPCSLTGSSHNLFGKTVGALKSGAKHRQRIGAAPYNDPLVEVAAALEDEAFILPGSLYRKIVNEIRQAAKSYLPNE